jgi:hypothetical protein
MRNAASSGLASCAETAALVRRSHSRTLLVLGFRLMYRSVPVKRASSSGNWSSAITRSKPVLASTPASPGPSFGPVQRSWTRLCAGRNRISV